MIVKNYVNIYFFQNLERVSQWCPTLQWIHISLTSSLCSWNHFYTKLEDIQAFSTSMMKHFVNHLWTGSTSSMKIFLQIWKSSYRNIEVQCTIRTTITSLGDVYDEKAIQVHILCKCCANVPYFSNDKTRGPENENRKWGGVVLNSDIGLFPYESLNVNLIWAKYIGIP